MSRLLGIDFGSRRIGIAIGDTGAGLARALTTIRRGATVGDDAASIAAIAERESVEELVVGLPLEASGETGPMAVEARGWAEEVGRLTRLPVRLRDERLTSYLAERRLGPMPRGRSGAPPSKSQRDAYRARVDREAAAIVLQDELDARAGGRAPAAEMSDHGGVTRKETGG